jgi:hypothetical protein
MISINPAEDIAADRLERRWFAAFRAASAARAECEALLEQMERIETAWNYARVRLAEIEGIRDALGEEVLQLEEPCVAAAAPVNHAAEFAA